jgi:hypothetical protein
MLILRNRDQKQKTLLSGKNSFLIQHKNTCLNRNSQDQITLYKQGHFIPLNGEKKSVKKALSMAQISNIFHSNQCGDKCSTIYKEYTTNKNPCPSAIFDPLLKFFTESSKSWSLVTTEDEKLKKDLEHIQAISQANSAILTQVVNNKAFTPFCPHIIKLLFKAYKSMKGETRENDQSDVSRNFRHYIRNDQERGVSEYNQYNEDDEYGDSWNNGFELNGQRHGHNRRGQNNQRNYPLQQEDEDYYEDYSQDYGSGDFQGNAGERNKHQGKTHRGRHQENGKSRDRGGNNQKGKKSGNSNYRSSNQQIQGEGQDYNDYDEQDYSFAELQNDGGNSISLSLGDPRGEQNSDPRGSLRGGNRNTNGNSHASGERGQGRNSGGTNRNQESGGHQRGGGDQSKGGQSKGGQSKGGQSKGGQSKGGQSKGGQSKGGQSKGGQSKDGQSKGSGGNSKSNHGSGGHQRGGRGQNRTSGKGGHGGSNSKGNSNSVSSGSENDYEGAAGTDYYSGSSTDYSGDYNDGYNDYSDASDGMYGNSVDRENSGDRESSGDRGSTGSRGNRGNGGNRRGGNRNGGSGGSSLSGEGSSDGSGENSGGRGNSGSKGNGGNRRGGNRNVDLGGSSSSGEGSSDGGVENSGGRGNSGSRGNGGNRRGGNRNGGLGGSSSSSDYDGVSNDYSGSTGDVENSGSNGKGGRGGKNGGSGGKNGGSGGNSGSGRSHGGGQRRFKRSVDNSTANENSTDSGQEYLKINQYVHKKKIKNTFPFGAWNWGLPDLGFVSGNPKCGARNPNCQGKQNVLDYWYSDCVCPWVWSGKSQKCPFGNDLNNTVAMASTLYLKNQPDFPVIDNSGQVFHNFSLLIESSPVQISDIDELLNNLMELMKKESNTSIAKLMQSYLGQLTQEFKQSMFNLIRELQGEYILKISFK